jgi:hypothetical protein
VKSGFIIVGNTIINGLSWCEIYGANKNIPFVEEGIREKGQHGGY